jgi:hypothetical protein
MFVQLKEGCILNIMKENKSLFSQLILKVGRTPDKAGQHRCRVDETKTWRTNHVWSTSFVENTSRPNLCALCALSGNKNNCVNQCKSVSNFPLCLSVLVAEIRLVRRSLLVRYSFPVLRSFPVLCSFSEGGSEGGSDGGGEGGSIKNNKLCETKPIFEKVKCL